MDESKNASVVQVLDPAVEAEKPSSPVRPAFAAGGALVALLFAVVIVFVEVTLQGWRRDPRRRSKMQLLGMYLRWKGAKE